MAENEFRKESIPENGPKIEVFTFDTKILIMLIFSFTGNLWKNSAIIFDHQGPRVRAELEAPWWTTVIQVFTSKELEPSSGPVISAPHTEETLPQPRPGRDVKSPPRDTKWPRHLLPENLNLRPCHGNLGLLGTWQSENPLKDRKWPRERKVLWVFDHRPEPGSFTDLTTIFLMEPRRNLILRIG